MTQGLIFILATWNYETKLTVLRHRFDIYNIFFNVYKANQKTSEGNIKLIKYNDEVS